MKNFTTAETAKILRASIRKKFPGTDFSVISKRYSGGSNITVYWKDGASGREVTDFVKQFEGSSFCGMEDLKTRQSSTWNGEPVQWGTDYVFCSRDYSKEMLQLFSDKVAKKYGVQPLQVVQDSPDGSPYFLMEGNAVVNNVIIEDNEYLSALINGAIFQADLTNLKASATDAGNDGSKPVSADPVSVNEVTIRENEVRDGVEIIFPARPKQEVLDYLNSKGFKWSPRQKLWYAKRSEKALAIAHGLAALCEVL